jgi:hypothetical protein
LRSDIPESLRVRILKEGYKILECIKKYVVDVIEVVGHTDEQPIPLMKSVFLRSRDC